MLNKYDIQMICHPLGKDRVFLIYRGQAHIGAVATAYWHQGEVKVELQELPHHRDGQQLAGYPHPSWAAA